MEDMTAYRALGAAHRRIRQWLVTDQGLRFPTDLALARAVEREIFLMGYRPAFPCMISIDDCVAHWTPSADPALARVITPDSLATIDFGLVDSAGRIVDAAFSVSSGQKNSELIKVSEGAAALAISMSGPDAIISDIGAGIQEYIESKEVDGVQVRSVWEFCGHSIEPWHVHGRKAVPNIKFKLPPSMRRMVEGEVYAIEPYPTLGETGDVTYRHDETQIWMFNYHKFSESLINPGLRKHFTLPFCSRWGATGEHLAHYDPMPPAYASGVTAQTEHNVVIRPERAEQVT